MPMPHPVPETLLIGRLTGSESALRAHLHSSTTPRTEKVEIAG